MKTKMINAIDFDNWVNKFFPITHQMKNLTQLLDDKELTGWYLNYKKTGQM